MKFADTEKAKLRSLVPGLTKAEQWEALEALDNQVGEIAAALEAARQDYKEHNDTYTAGSLLKLLRAAGVSETSSVGLEIMGLAAAPNEAEGSTGGTVHRQIGDILVNIRGSVKSAIGT